MGKQLNVENSVISAKDDALFYNAMLQKNGVWQYGNKLYYEIISANQINIKDGMVTAQGRNYVIYPNEVDSLTIENGTVNTKRNDLIVYEVSKTSEGEQVGLKVIKGTSATTPTDPILIQENTLVSGSKYQMPLYRVRLNGINIEGVDDLREYIVSFGNLVNDNLLINSDFRNPINQRGETSYTGSSIYTVDRWMISKNETLSIQDGFIRATSNTAQPYILIQQKVEMKSTCVPDVMTLSFKIRASKKAKGQLYDTNRFFDVGTDWSVINIVFTKEEIQTSNMALQDNHFRLYVGIKDYDNPGVNNFSSGDYFDVEWCKLERGSIATPFVPRPYAEELALCQRYYLKIVETCMIITRQRFDGNISYYPGFVLPNEVRTVGTAIYESKTPDKIVLTGKLQAIIDRGCVNYFNIWGDYPNVEITKFVIDAEIY